MISREVKVLPVPANVTLSRNHTGRRCSTAHLRAREQRLHGSTNSLKIGIHDGEELGPVQLVEFVETDEGENTRIVLNVGGTRHETTVRTLLRYPGTPLAELAKFHTNEKVEYFIDRHPTVFASILNFYRSDELHVPLDICGALMHSELEYWGISEDLIEPCCWTSYCVYKEAQKTLADLDIDIDVTNEAALDNAPEGESTVQSIRRRIYCVLEDPYYSACAKVVAFITFFMICLSILGLILETHHAFRVVDKRTYMLYGVNSTNQKGKRTLTRPHPILEYLDYACTIYFTLEFLLRFIVSPNKRHFWKSPLNVMDFTSLIPLYVVILLDCTVSYMPMRSLREKSRVENASILKIALILRVARVFRLFKLMKQYTALKILVYAVRASFRELLMLASFLLLFVILFATFIYYAEQDQLITSIPLGFWWAVITMTTVGYGDVYPRTVCGYVLGALCAVCGVLVVALTIPIISNNFTVFYSHAQSRSKMYRTIQRREGFYDDKEEYAYVSKAVKKVRHKAGHRHISGLTRTSSGIPDATADD